MTTRTVAAFDVDGTLTDRDCVVPFLRRISGDRTLLWRLAVQARHVVPAAARRDRDTLKALASRAAFAGRPVDDVAVDAERFAAEVAGSWLRPDAEELVADHRSRGDAIVLVSASYEIYLRPLATLLGGAEVVATRLASEETVFTGELDGANCRGPEKVRRLHAWLAAHHGGRRAVRVVAYGDSTGDRELLCDADVARWRGRAPAPSWFPV